LGLTSIFVKGNAICASTSASGRVVGGQDVCDDIVSAFLVGFGTAKCVVTENVVLFFTFARYFVREDW